VPYGSTTTAALVSVPHIGVQGTLLQLTCCVALGHARCPPRESRRCSCHLWGLLRRENQKDPTQRHHSKSCHHLSPRFPSSPLCLHSVQMLSRCLAKEHPSLLVCPLCQPSRRISLKQAWMPDLYLRMLSQIQSVWMKFFTTDTRFSLSVPQPPPTAPLRFGCMYTTTLVLSRL